VPRLSNQFCRVGVKERHDLHHSSTNILKNRYQLGEVIGHGASALVYRAVDTSLGREVAVKLFPAANDGPQAAAQEAEVSLLASLSHHGLVTLLDAGVDRTNSESPQVFLVMEYVPGLDLERRLANGPLGGRQIAQIGLDLAEALHYTHSKMVVHRDIKPSNILLVDYANEASTARARLTDFGIAHRGPQQHGDSATTTGTAAYLSPEQARRELVGPASDIYSLGLVVIECFTGQIAFPGEPVETIAARLTMAPPIPEDLPWEWRDLLTAMTALNAFDRPTAADLVAAMRQLMNLEIGKHRIDDSPGTQPHRHSAIEPSAQQSA
jgi:eukaryotic-like serine/threonine-protein kinase